MYLCALGLPEKITIFPLKPGYQINRKSVYCENMLALTRIYCLLFTPHWNVTGHPVCLLAKSSKWKHTHTTTYMWILTAALFITGKMLSMLSHSLMKEQFSPRRNKRDGLFTSTEIECSGVRQLSNWCWRISVFRVTLVHENSGKGER